jgi:preprotein translocase subunit YajC
MGHRNDLFRHIRKQRKDQLYRQRLLVQLQTLQDIITLEIGAIHVSKVGKHFAVILALDQNARSTLIIFAR